MLYQAKEHKLDLGDVQMDYITFGRGTKPLIMIQGLRTNSIHGAALPLAYMYRIFAKDYKVYLFDRRKNLPQHITVRAIAADIARAMDHLSLQDADVFGVSLGGMIAQYLAIDRPDLVHKLVLAVTLSKKNALIESAVSQWIAFTEQQNFKALVTDMTYRLYSEKYMKRYRPFLPLFAYLQKPRDAQRFITLANAALSCQTYNDLHKIQCPVFVIGGRKDQVTGSEGSEEIARRLQCELYMYSHLGHAAYEEAKDFNRRVYQFLTAQ